MRIPARKVEIGDTVQYENTWATVRGVTVLPADPIDPIPEETAVITTNRGNIRYGADWEIFVDFPL